MRHTRTWLGLMCYCLLAMAAHAQVQTPSFHWAHVIGDTSVNYSRELAECPDGHLFVATEYGGTIDLDPGPGTILSAAAVAGPLAIQKLDSLGQLIWARVVGAGVGEAVCGAMEVDAAGNLYVVGSYHGALDFDPGPGQAIGPIYGSWDMFMLKLDALGNFVWLRTIGSGNSGQDWVTGATLDALGNVFVVGRFQGIVDFDPGPGSATAVAQGMNSGFLLKLDPAGNFGWVKNVHATGFASCNEVAIDSLGNFGLVGYFQGVLDADPGAGAYNLPSFGVGDIFLLKLDSAGNFIWGQHMGGTNDDDGRSIVADAAGNFYIAGILRDSADFDPSPTAASWLNEGGYACYVAKYSSLGQFRWAGAIHQTGYTPSGRALAIDRQRQVYWGFVYQDSVDIDPHPQRTYFLSHTATHGMGLAKLDSLGNLVWAGTMEGTLKGNVYDVLVNRQGQVFASGTYAGTTDFDPTTGVAAHAAVSLPWDAFVTRWGECSSPTRTIMAQGCDNYALPWDMVYASGTYVHHVPSTAGCDSLLRAEVTLSRTDTVIAITTCEPFVLNNISYFASGTYVQHLVNGHGCDSTIELRLTSTAPVHYLFYASCDSFSYRGITYTSSGVYRYDVSVPSGCDSAVILTLALYPSSETVLDTAVCNAFTFQGSTYTSSGNYTHQYSTVHGCDSLHRLNLTIYAPTAAAIYDTACSSYTLHGQTYTTAGSHVQTLTNVHGCDSLLTLHLTLLQSAGVLTAGACDSISRNGATYFASGQYVQHLTNAQGCDSTLTLNLSIYHDDTTVLDVASCIGYFLGSQFYTLPGTYTESLQTTHGCDSTTILNLDILASTFGSLIVTACDSFTVNGQTFYSTGNYTQSLYNVAGCDSSLGIFLTLRPSTMQTIADTACVAYAFGGQTLTASGTYLHVFSSAVTGCDSTVELNLTLIGNNAVVLTGTTLTAQASNATYQWLDCNNGMAPIPGATGQAFTPTANGHYAVQVTEQNGCIDTSACVQVIVVGLGAQPTTALALHPNPNDGRCILTITGATDAVLQFIVVDALGRKVWQGAAQGDGPHALDFGALPAGMYYLRAGLGESGEDLKFCVVR